jgi:Cu/Zn superoxide dismutase
MIAPAAAAVLLLAACGGSDNKSSANQSGSSATGSSPPPAAATSMPGMTMGSPTATSTPEPLAPGTYEGTFSTLSGAPSGTGTIAGTATMLVSKSGTKVSIAVSGLDPKAVYIAHVHKQSCAEDGGGTHFQFTPGGEAKPPNEVWLTPVSVTSTGKGTATTSTDKPVNSDAKSVVIHLKRAPGASTDEATPPKLACADLARQSSSAQPSPSPR